MHAVNLTISARELDTTVKYQSPTKRFMVQQAKEEEMLFLANTLAEEVNKGTEAQRIRNIKKLKKLLRVTVSVGAAGIQMAPRAFAAPVDPLASGSLNITPDVIMAFGLKAALISVSVGLGLSMTMLTIAGMYRMFRKRREAQEWTTDIIRGLVQVLISVPTVYLLYYLAQLIFKNFSVLSGLF